MPSRETTTNRGRVFVGTSGWAYRSWRQHLYDGVPAKKWLQHASRVFNALEINGSFYTQIKPQTYARWAEETPPGFVFALKGHRFITHYKRLGDVSDSVRRVREPAMQLGKKLRVALWQVPDTMRVDLPRLAGFLEDLKSWPEIRHTIELRHRSWFNDTVGEMLERAGVAAAISDAPDFPLWKAVTTNLVYVRLHGHTRKYASSYSRPSLRRWAADVTRWARAGNEVHVYFDNDAEGAAVRNARTMMEELRDLLSPRGAGIRPPLGGGALL